MKKAVTRQLNHAKPLSSIIIVLCLLLCATHSFAQETDMPPAYEIKTDTALSVQIPEKYVQALDDKAGNLTFDQVMQPSVARGFHYMAIDNLVTNDPAIFKHPYWFRYVLRNTMDHDARICLHANSQESAFYVKSGQDGWHHFENGYATPRSRQPGLRWLGFVPLVIKPGEQMIIVNRTYNNHTYPFWPAIASFGSTDRTIQQFLSDRQLHSDKTSQADYLTFTHDSVLFGILFFAAVINFFFFLVVRERVFLYFSLYLFMIAVGRMDKESYFIFLAEHRVFWLYLMMFIWHFNWIALILFIRELLHTKANLPKWDKFLVVIAIGSVVVNLYAYVSIVGYFDYLQLSDFISFIIIVVSILTSLMLSLNKKSIERSLKILIVPVFMLWGLFSIITVSHYFLGYDIVGKMLSAWVYKAWMIAETLSLTWLAIGFSWILLQRFRRMQKQIVQQALDREKEKNQLIAEQKVELEKTVEERTAELKNSLTELRSTQSQLIQREKMASLGELTAGIAHEIQNPLNFVNNFSDVNREMVGELKQELLSGNIDDAIAIADELQQNEEKINHHGKRADFIVKGMLQHSRTSTGEKQLTNMNVLCDEFLKLSYHGLRAKDKSFNAEMITHFDPNLPKVNVSQQDLGRVMLNLFNNAFYAVHEKAKTAGPNYKPTVEVSTTQQNGSLMISVKDNGTGIPENIREKIMQPFFTTKPTGEGTGLGLSLSYDIVVKGHGGTITVNSVERDGAEFVITLPIS